MPCIVLGLNIIPRIYNQKLVSLTQRIQLKYKWPAVKLWESKNKEKLQIIEKNHSRNVLVAVFEAALIGGLNQGCPTIWVCRPDLAFLKQWWARFVIFGRFES